MNEQLIFILVPETVWGIYSIQPCRATDMGEYYRFLGKNVADEDITKDEKAVVRICRRLEHSSLYALYGKKYKTEADFLQKPDEHTQKQVSNYISKQVAEVLELLYILGTPLFLYETRIRNLYKSEQLILSVDKLKPFLGFYRDEEKIRYILRLQAGPEEIIPSEHTIRIVSEIPGWILVDYTLYPLPEGFSGTRVRPFTDKKEVLISRQNEETYFRKFILKNIVNQDIEVEGFEVLEINPPRKALVSIETDVFSCRTLQLLFRYGESLVSFFNQQDVIVYLKEEGDQYRFFKIVRDRRWEKEYAQILLDKGLKMGGQHFLIPESQSEVAVVEWLQDHKNELAEAGVEISTEGSSENYYLEGWQLAINRTETNDWFELKADVILETGEKIPFQAFREHILTGNRIFRMKDHRIFLIPEEWFARYAGLFLFARPAREGYTLRRSQYNLVRSITREYQTVETPVSPVPVPSGLRATLRSYQQEGYQWMYNLYRQKFGICLADDMGLGKTIQTLALLLKYKEEVPKSNSGKNPSAGKADLFSTHPSQSSLPEYRTSLIVAPASVVHNWVNELKKFSPSLTAMVYTGIARDKKREAMMSWDVVITTYQTLRNDIAFLSEKRFGFVVFDEAQNFKNRTSQVYKAVCRIEADHYVALSGTPVENSLSDLWSLMSVINPGLLGDHTTFQNYFIQPITADISGLRSENLRTLIAPFVLRRKKEAVLSDLPERMDEVIYCDMEVEQQRIYQEELSRVRNLIMENSLAGNSYEPFAVLKAINKLRQISLHPGLVDTSYQADSAKVTEIFRMLEEIGGSGHKVLLFSAYVSFLDIIACEMQARKWKYAMLTGTTTNREEVIRSFAEVPDCNFFLISLKAGGVGLNLTQADYVFILDPWWNIAAEEQAISRAHRIGQRNSVFVYRFVTVDTLEEKIRAVQEKKRDLADAILSSGENFLPNREELEKLLR